MGKRRHELDKVKTFADFNYLTGGKFATKALQSKLTADDLWDSYQEGYQRGAIREGENIVQAIYASIVRTLFEAGNDHEEVLSFLTDVDNKFIVSFSGDEDCQQVLDDFGFRIRFRDTLERVQG